MRDCTLLLSERLFDNLQVVWPKLKVKEIEPCYSPYELLFRSFNLSKDVSVVRLFNKMFPHLNDKTLLACPVTVHTEATGAFIDPVIPELTKDEIEVLLAALNDFYEDTQWSKLTNFQFAVTFENLPKWKLPKIERAIGKNLQFYIHEDVSFAKFATELQMMLEGLPFNQKRKEQNLPPVNFLWIWGAGETVFEFEHQPIELLVGHALIHATLAEYNESRYQSLIEFCDSEFLSQPATCLIDMNDYFVSYVDEKYFEKIIEILKLAIDEKIIGRLNIQTMTKRVEIKKNQWWPFS